MRAPEVAGAADLNLHAALARKILSDPNGAHQQEACLPGSTALSQPQYRFCHSCTFCVQGLTLLRRLQSKAVDTTAEVHSVGCRFWRKPGIFILSPCLICQLMCWRLRGSVWQRQRRAWQKR